MIQYFYKPYSIKSCYKILVIFPVLYISMVSNLFSTGDQCHGRQIFHGRGRRQGIQDDSSDYISCAPNFISDPLGGYDRHLKSSGIRSQRLGNPCITSICFTYFIPSSLYLFPVLPVSLSSPHPSGNHQFVLCMYESVSLLLYSFVCFVFQVPHRSENIQYPYFSDQLH